MQENLRCRRKAGYQGSIHHLQKHYARGVAVEAEHAILVLPLPYQSYQEQAMRQILLLIHGPELDVSKV